MKFRLQTIRLGTVAAATMLGFTAMAQTPVVSAPVAVPTDAIAAYQQARDAARRDELSKAAKVIAAAPAVNGAVEHESAAPAAGSAPVQKAEGGKIEQGLQIHGHWVIDVRNPDGTLAGHHDFQNSLQFPGTFVLGGILNGEFVPANWMISLGGSPLICGGGSNGVCGIVQSLTTAPGSNYCSGGAGICVTGLTTNFSFSAIPVSFVLTGSFTATQSGNVNQVATNLGYCYTAPGATYSPQSCATSGATGNGAQFSATSITAIPVASGQIVQVSVTFTFS